MLSYFYGASLSIFVIQSEDIPWYLSSLWIGCFSVIESSGKSNEGISNLNCSRFIGRVFHSLDLCHITESVVRSVTWPLF